MTMASNNQQTEFYRLMSSIENTCWSKKTYTVREIIADISLPVVAMVTESYLHISDQEIASYSTCEILWLNEASKQKRVIMETPTGKYWSVPMSPNIKIWNEDSKGHQQLSEMILEDEVGKWNFIHQEISDNCLDELEHNIFRNKVRIVCEDDMMFLTGYCLDRDLNFEDCGQSTIKHHSMTRLALGKGIKSKKSAKWKKLCEDLTQFMNMRINKLTLPGITACAKETVEYLGKGKMKTNVDNSPSVNLTMKTGKDANQVKKKTTLKFRNMPSPTSSNDESYVLPNIFPKKSSHNSKLPVHFSRVYERNLPKIPSLPQTTYNSYNEIPQSVTDPENIYVEVEDIPQEMTKLTIKSRQILGRNDLPDDLNNLSINQVADCLHLLHLDRHIDAFKGNDIDGTILGELTNDILVNDLGLTRIEALKLRKFVDQKWLPIT
ncbi:uncharacterized protein [Antedon mediterranea]|uniref:uncharacterized protein n=1 Tax=Antedon mediterranea TaxID=105859 RepID=UPI003AF86C4C